MKKRFKRIYVEITNICNMNCNFCPPTTREQKFMNVDEFEEILKKIKSYTNYVYLHVKGEPLIHPNLEEILQLCSKYNLMVNITTNGTLLNKNKQVLINASIRQINISLHNNNPNLEDTIQIAKDIAKKTNTIIQFRLWNLKKIQDNTKIITILEQIFKTKISNETKKVQLKLTENIFLHFDYLFEWPNINSKKEIELGTCKGLKSQIAILVDGSIVPCCLDNNGDITLGNIFESELDTILETDRVKNIIKNFNNNLKIEKLCQNCQYNKSKQY